MSQDATPTPTPTPAPTSGETFTFTINIQEELPESGKPIYATGSVNAKGSGTGAPAAYFKWTKGAGDNYTVSLEDPSTLGTASANLASNFAGAINTMVAGAVSTTIAQSIPFIAKSTVVNPSVHKTDQFQVSSIGHIQKGMKVSGGMTGSGNAFAGGVTVTNIDIGSKTVTTSAKSLVPLASGASIKFSTGLQAKQIQVKDSTGIKAGMHVSGGATPPTQGFVADTKVTSVEGNTVHLSQDTAANAVTEGAKVSFTEHFPTGTKTFTLDSVAGLKIGLMAMGGETTGNNFSEKTRISSIDTGTNQVTLSEGCLNPIHGGAPISFVPVMLQTVYVEDATNIKAGMSISGGAASPTGDAFSPDAYVASVDIANKSITLSDLVPFLNLSAGSTLNFTDALPSQQIGTSGTASTVTVAIPNSEKLGGGRLIFTIGDKGQCPVNSSNKPTAPVPYAGNMATRYYDFVEFAWTPSSTNLNYDTSIVDQFGLPITIEFPGAKPMLRGVPVKAETVFSNYKTGITDNIASYTPATGQPTVAQAESFFKGLASFMAPYRILAPADAMLYNQLPSIPSVDKDIIEGVATFFDDIIKAFFDKYDLTKPNGTTFVMKNVAGVKDTGKNGSGFHDLSGSVVTNQPYEATDGNTYNYKVLQLADNTPNISAANGKKWVYNIIYPFFSSNSKEKGAPPPPRWLNAGKYANGKLIPTSVTPTMMVFGASGVFADSDVGNKAHPTPKGATANEYQVLLGAIENQIVTAFNRGIALAPQWRWLYQSTENSATAELKPQVTVNTGNTLTIKKSAFVAVFEGMSVTELGTGGHIDPGTNDDPNIVTDVSIKKSKGQGSEKGVGDVTVTLSKDNLKATGTGDTVQALFSYNNVKNPFYQTTDPMSGEPFNGVSFDNNGGWDYFSQFFHIPYTGASGNGVSIKGLAYAYAFDDQGNFSSDISKDGVSNAVINLGTKKPS